MTRKVLEVEDIDRLGLALLSLGRELWVLKDRQRMLEDLLETNGIIAPDAVDQHQPTGATGDSLNAELEQFISGFAGPFAPAQQED